jgi:hypothetical protein
MTKPTTSPSPKVSKKQDGKPSPRRRFATASSEDVVAISPARKLGFRPAEFAALTGVSPVTIWRGIKTGKIETIDHCGIKIVPRAFAIRAGFITADDAI